MQMSISEMQMNGGDKDSITEKILNYLYKAYQTWDLSSSF